MKAIVVPVDCNKWFERFLYVVGIASGLFIVFGGSL